jgi:hypothetical protein
MAWNAAALRAILFGVAFVAATAASALADPPASPPSAAAPTAPPAATDGLAVVALAGATDAAWPLASAIYAATSLRPVRLDEAHAHVLCGEAAPAGAPVDVRDVADMVASLHGDDAPSRALLGDIARRFAVRGVVVVRVDARGPEARVFLADSASFDAASYAPDSGSLSSWSAATRSLVRAFGTGVSAGREAAAPPSAVRAPALATHREPEVAGTPRRPREFYESGWFWGAVGAAAFGAGAVFLATRDTGPSAIHLQLEVPH